MKQYNNILSKLFILIAFTTRYLVVADDRLDIFFNEVRSLSELPMDKLINIKSAFSKQEIQEDDVALQRNSELSSPELPMALALKRPYLKPVRRHDDYWQDEKGKGSKVSKIFQLAITALSFFAFGGYLMTLIITAIRRNSAATSTGNVIFLQSLQGIRRPKRKTVFHDPMENDFNIEKLYRGMIMLSEGYALYN